MSDEVDDAVAPSKAPAFQFYPKDFLTDERVTLMSMQERGVYITLICKCWTEGTLPADPQLLARLCGFPVAAFRKCWPAIAPCFRACPRDADRLVHPRLEKERQKQRAFRRRQADNGRKGGRPPLADKPKHNPSLLQNAAKDPPVANPHKSSAFAISDLRSATPVKRERASLSADDELAERAARFLERYQALYVKHRRGAHYLVRPHLDFPKAKELCAVWGDERLDQLAVVFLTTDHKFAEEGSRTIGQFAALASWCDGRLAEAGIA